MVNFFEYLRDNNLLFKVLITVTPYDEINCEAPEDIALDIANKLHEIMKKAGAFFVKKCILDADISWNKHKDENGKEVEEIGVLPTYWIH